MSIADEINQLNSNLSSSYTSVNNKEGTLPANQCFDNLPDAIDTITEGGDLTTLNVTPTTSAQTITPSGDIDGYNLVEVAAVTSAIDNNIQPENIITGKTILNVNGSATVLNGETRSVSLTNKNGQTYTPSTGKNGITSITVTPNNQARTVNPSTSQQSLTVNSGYSGNGTITVNAVNSSIDQNIVANKIKKDVVILGVTGSYEGEGANIDSLNVTPTTSAQTITASGGVDGYSPVNVSAVTSSIDSNIVPNKIRNGCVILGVEGTYGEPLNNMISLSDRTSGYLIDEDFYVCGDSYYGQQGIEGQSSVTIFTKRGESIAQIALSSHTSGYLTTSGDFYLCGYNQYGQQGNGTSGSGTNVKTFTKRGESIAQIALTQGASGYLTTSGDFYLCGSNGDGRQGSGDTTNVKTFTKRGSNVAQMFLGEYSTGYITTSGDFYLCGGGGGQGAGSPTDVSTFTKRGSNVAQVALGPSTSGYITTSGDFYLCGNNLHGQQGNGTSGGGATVLTFTKRSSNVAQIAFSYYTSGYITTSGDFYLCGYNNYGQQGNGTSGSGTDVLTFTKVAENVAQIALSQNTSGYLTTSGDFYLCGYNQYGQQGTGDTSNVTTFRKVAENVAKIFLSNNTSGYLTTINDFYLCGYNVYSQQGSGDTTAVKTFTKRN